MSGGRLGLRSAEPDRLGTLRLRTLGRRSGQERAVMLYYLADGPNLAVVASNAGADDDPAWWLNLQAAPDAFVDLPEGLHAVVGRTASQLERERLWPRFVRLSDVYQRHEDATDRTINVVILEMAKLATSGGRSA